MAETALLPADIKRTILIRQVAFLIGIAASVALGVYVVLWSQTPNYSLLYGSLSDQDIAQVMEVLQKSAIEYRIDDTSGAVMVPSGKVRDARMKLAAENLPRSANIGFGILQEEQKLGTSQFIERARYQYALESELAKTIEKVSSVRHARIHLALPKQSIFSRDKKLASASVMLDLYSGHLLETSQVTAIANLVAASVPHLQANHVSIIDQLGRLLTEDGDIGELVVSNKQFQYAQRVEKIYIKKIEDILAPIVGPDGVKAQVAAEFDFTSTEQTRESFNPDLPSLRSEQIEEERQSAGTIEGGVPGSFSNQPFVEASAPEIIGAESNNTSSEQIKEISMQRRAVRNYELDRTISHTRMPVGTLRRLSVALLLDYKRINNGSGDYSYREYSPEEINQITALVKDAVGYNALRGDTVSVMNTQFTRPDPIEPLPAEPFWKQSWLWDIVKQVLGGVVVLFLIFGVLRPAMKNLVNKEMSMQQALLAVGGVSGELPAPDGESAKHDDQIKGISSYDSSLTAVKSVVSSDSKLAAQVVKNWVGED